MKELIYRDALVWYRHCLRILPFIMIPGGIIASLTLKASGVIVQESGLGFLMFLPLNLLFLEDENDTWDKYLRSLSFSVKKIVMSGMIMFAGFQVFRAIFQKKLSAENTLFCFDIAKIQSNLSAKSLKMQAL